MKNGKRRKLVATGILGCVFFAAAAQTNSYQLRNSDFEAPFVPAPGASGTGTEPPYWHSFGSLTGSQASLARSGAQISQSSDTRYGVGYSCKINARTVMLIATANGNMTTGRVNAGSTTASNAANNNFTDPVDTNFNEPWTSTPDSIRFWAKYTPNSATQWARFSGFIHDDYKVTDPLAGDANSANYIVASAELEWQRGDQGWHQYTVPFDYAAYAHLGQSPKYILLTFTTNRTPGSGSSSDALYIDDIEMVYSAWLTDLKVNGTTIAGFEKGLLTYGGPKLVGSIGSFAFPYQPSDFTWTTEVNDVVSVVVTNVSTNGVDADGGYTSILITAEDSITQVEYRMYYSANLSDDNDIAALSYTMHADSAAIPVPGFVSSTLNYPVSLIDPEEVRIPLIREEDVILSDPMAEVYRINQPTSVNSVGSVVVRAENYSLKTYTLTFSKVISTDSTLSMIKVGGTDIANFHPDTLAYDTNITACVTSIPTITVVASPWAEVNITQASMSNRTATILVTAESGSKTTYTVNFNLINNNANLTGYRVGSTNQNVFNDTTFVHTYTASFTAAQTLSIQASQQVCSQSTINRTPSSTVYYPDTNYFTVTAQDGITTETYKVVMKNTNCYLATGNNNGIRYNYNGLTNQTAAINITSTNNNNTNTVITAAIATPAGPPDPPEIVVYGLAAASAAAPPTYQIIQPTSRTDTAEIILTANDGVTQKIYRVPVRPTLSTDASLSGIMCNDSAIVGFTPNLLYYTVMLPANATQVPNITATPTFQWLPAGNIVVTPAIDLLDTTKIVVTAENGTTTRTYYIDFDVEPVDNAYLSVLKYDNNVIAGFRATTLIYSVDIPYSTAVPPVLSGTPMAANASVFYTQPSTIPYQGKVLVISENMVGMKIYTVNFNMVKNTDTTLADIKINGVSLQDFDPQVFTYNYALPYTELTAPVVSATSAYAFAQVNITQIDTIMGTVTIAVTAEDNLFTALYTIDFSREPSPIADIDTIKYSYNSQDYAYYANGMGTTPTIWLPVETEGDPLITDIVLADNRADYIIDEQPDILLNNLTGTVTVTAEDLTTEIYGITFQRTLSSSTLLTDITYNGGTSINFDPNITTYYVILPFTNAQNPVVAATADWKNTNVSITQPATPFGQASILVNSEDGQHNQTYTIYFQRKGNPKLVSLSYNLGGSPIAVPNFHPDTLEYNIVLNIGETAIPALEYVAEDSRCMVDTIQQITANGTSQLKFVTWNQDDSLTYTVNFTVALSTEALLSDLMIDGITIENFDVNRINYAVEVNYGYGKDTLPMVTAVATQPDAVIEITQITEYPGDAVVTVYAGDTTISQTYRISFSMEPGNNTYLSELLVDEELLWNFNRNVFFYEIKLPYGTTEPPLVSADVEDERSEITITQAEQIGDTAKIEVMALNGDVAVYQVFFVERKNPNALAKSISIDWQELEEFDPYTRNYTYDLPANYGGIPFVTVELQNPNATYTIIPPTTVPAQTQIIITAEDTDSTFSYRINFRKSTVSVASYDNQTQIQVYPNPSSDKIYFDINGLPQTSTLEIYAIDGRLIGNHILQNGINTICIEDISNGMYFYKIISEKVVIGTGKFIKN